MKFVKSIFYIAFLVCISLTINFILTNPESSSCPDGYALFEDKCLKVECDVPRKTGYTWWQALDLCSSEPGHGVLPTPKSDEMNDFLVSLVRYVFHEHNGP